MPEITVAITAYNLENYIHACIHELMNQTFQNFEIVVYDDCSKDKTREILLKCKDELEDKLRLIFGENPQRLPSKARNAILDSGEIHGKYIVFLDGDDSIEPTFLEELYNTAEKFNADIALCAYDRVEDGTGHVLCQEMRGYPQCFQLGEADAPSVAFINTSLWNKLIRTDCIGDLRLPEFSVGEDASFLQAIYMGCDKIASVDKVLLHYRVRSNSVISNTPEETIYSFAQELYRLWCKTDDAWMRENIALAAFIHIGLSMPLRAYDNPNIETKHVLWWVRRYFANQYHWFRGNRYFSLVYLVKQGVKGIGCWGALLCHKLGCFSLFLWVYKTVTQTLKIDIKF